jgi:hypothetical protein
MDSWTVDDDDDDGYLHCVSKAVVFQTLKFKDVCIASPLFNYVVVKEVQQKARRLYIAQQWGQGDSF